MRYLTMLSALILLALLAGCGGGGRPAGPVGSQTGSVGIRVVWPAQAEVNTALIPAASNSIKVELLQDDAVLMNKTVVIDRPQTEGRIDGVPVGVTIMRAQAYPEAGAGGVPQAKAERAIEVRDGEYTEWPLTLASTITNVVITPLSPVEVTLGTTVQLVASAEDEDEQTVLLPESNPFAWQMTAGTEYASVNGDGLVTPVRSGSATVQVTELESGIFGTATLNVTNNQGGYQFVLKWGEGGYLNGQFHPSYGPAKVAVGPTGDIFVADHTRIQKFTNQGVWLATWGTLGSGDGQFDSAQGVAVDAAGNVYVADFGNYRIQKFTSDGTFLTKWGSYGTGDGQFSSLYQVSVDGSGNVYATDINLDRIQKFTSTGTFVTKWGSLGTGDGQFDDPIEVAADSAGYVYVTDRGNRRVQKFTNGGVFVTKWGSAGTEDGQFGTSSPHGIAVDAAANVYVADRSNRRIQKFTSDGTFLTKWGSQGPGNMQFGTMNWIAVDIAGFVYVTDRQTDFNGIKKYRPVLPGGGDVGIIVN
jgi:sugar lactone lactonase YvrE